MMQRAPSLSFAILALVCMALGQPVIDPRGTRPMEPGTRANCENQKEWALCYEEDWGPKCPSGCRIQGLLEKKDHDLLKRIDKIRNLLARNKDGYQHTAHTTSQTYDYLKEQLTSEHDASNKYFDVAHNLRNRITKLQIVINQQLTVLNSLKQQIKDQVDQMQRLEVDIDIKLRACKGSCKVYSEYTMEAGSYVSLDKQLNQLLQQQVSSSPEKLQYIKKQELTEAIKQTTWKGIQNPAQRMPDEREDPFADVNTTKLVLETEGSETAPATISKDVSKGTTSWSHQTGHFDSTKGGIKGGDFHQDFLTSSTSSVSCHKTIKKTIVNTKDGPVEHVEVVYEGGPNCDTINTPSGSSTFTSSSSSSSSSSSTHSSSSHSSKGSLLGDTKLGGGGFDNPFLTFHDFGKFSGRDVDEDIPDLKARSLMPMRVERQADYVGKDCVDAFQNHLNGEANGLFRIKLGTGHSTDIVEVYCRQEGLLGGWLLVQQRESGAVDFNRSWSDYRDGFGSIDARGNGELWLGNKYLHLLTGQGESLLKVEMEDVEGGEAMAEYTVRVGPEGEGYPLQVSMYSGDAGDALISNNGMKFSTFDSGNGNSGHNCAVTFGGGWWYNDCHQANPNGIYLRDNPDQQTLLQDRQGVLWAPRAQKPKRLKKVRMLIRPATF